MSKEYVRDFGGKILATIETDAKGNKVTREFGGKIINRYDSRLDVTRNFGGKILAKGDISSSLRKD